MNTQLNSYNFDFERLEGLLATFAIEANLRHTETERKFQESERFLAEKFKSTDERIDKLARLYGGVSDNSKDVAEEFFFRGLKNRKELFGIDYEHIDTMSRHKGKLQGQYDIVLYNGNKIIVIEVKYKLHPNDVDDFYNRKLPKFKLLYPEYNDKKIIGGVAALSVPNESIEKAMAYGFLVLTQSGDDLSVLNSSDFELQMF